MHVVVFREFWGFREGSSFIISIYFLIQCIEFLYVMVFRVYNY